MRVTQTMLSSNMLKNLSNSYASMDKYMDQLSTGKKINRPSDDPVIASKGIDYRSQVSEVKQYQRNIGEVHTWMDNSDAALDKATKALQKMRELAVQASNDTYGEDERKNVKEEVEQLKEHLTDIANTKVNDKYIFNGTNTDQKPTLNNSNSSDPVMIEVASGTKLQANVNGSNIFNEELFNSIENENGNDDDKGLIDALADNDQGEIEDSIADLDEQIDNVINERADLGARMNRLDLVENRLSEQETIAKKTMSDNEDVDYEKVITNLKSQESVHRAALSAGGRVIQPTLLDFLR